MMQPGRRGTDYHLARILILLKHFGNRGPLKGLTKLAKLDFLLRYPAFTDRLLQERGLSWQDGAEPVDSERNAVESRMIRYKYGPWDDRYYSLLGSLVGLGLATVQKKGKTLEIQLTQEGLHRSQSLSQEPEWRDIDLRAKTLKKSFNYTGARLKNMIYQELPEVVDRPHRVEI